MGLHSPDMLFYTHQVDVTRRNGPILVRGDSPPETFMLHDIKGIRILLWSCGTGLASAIRTVGSAQPIDAVRNKSSCVSHLYFYVWTQRQNRNHTREVDLVNLSESSHPSKCAIPYALYVRTACVPKGNLFTGFTRSVTTNTYTN